MRDRFDLEQDIMNCWSVVDDVKMLLRQDAVNSETMQAIATLYQQKFECLWESFEDCCAQFSASRQTYGVEDVDNT